HLIHDFGELSAAEGTVQDRDVEGIEHIFIMLEPVAGRDRAAAAADRRIVGINELAFVHGFKAIVARLHRLLVRWPHVGEDQTVAFFDGIPRLSNSVAMLAHLRFAGLLEAMALY